MKLGPLAAYNAKDYKTALPLLREWAKEVLADQKQFTQVMAYITDAELKTTGKIVETDTPATATSPSTSESTAAIPSAIGPSGRPLVYYHDKSIGKPASWDNAKWRAVREESTEHFVFYSIVPVEQLN